MIKVLNILNKILCKFYILYLNRIINKETKFNSIRASDTLSHLKFEVDDQQNIISELSRNLRQNTLSTYKDRFKDIHLKIMIHTPDEFSMGGQSVFENWVEGLNYMGVKTISLPWNQPQNNVIKFFKPDLILTSDHPKYLNQIDWDFIKYFRMEHECLFVLTASHEEDGNTPNRIRLEEAKKHDVDFFVSFQNEQHLSNNYHEWKDFGYNILSIPFSGNPITYYYPGTLNQKYDFSFLGSTNPDKAYRYFKYFSRILQLYKGIIIGPGWKFNKETTLKKNLHSNFYHSANIALNLHIPSQIDNNTELNERTYSIACCGVFQLIDNPKSLLSLFEDPNKIASASSPKEYIELFEYFLNNPQKKTSYILYALEQVYSKHTIFHRMSTFIEYYLYYKSISSFKIKK